MLERWARTAAPRDEDVEDTTEAEAEVAEARKVEERAEEEEEAVDPVESLRTRLRAFYDAHGEPDKAAASASIIDTVLKKTKGDVEAAEAVMNQALAGMFNGDTI